MMKKTLHTSIVKTIKEFHGFSKDCYIILQEKYKYSVDEGTLFSILSHEYQRQMKYSHTKSPNVINKYFNLYEEALVKREDPGIILRIAVDADISPCLIAKLILQKYYENTETDGENINVNKYLRDTTLIENIDLAYECTLYDDQYSPAVETMKSSIGQQYEILLHKQMTDLGIAFRDEEYLRKFGYDKTPDFKLEVPIAIDGFIINWIESKALFGDEDVHRDYIKHQYSSYWNRFGPGLVIYWFGYIETIIQSSEKRFIVRNNLPNNFIAIGK
ncbi:hypothetical protein MML48_2g00006309 [Holotrichia oblita]|uniref:Uncharacterized protein n=1 Tax=Holotrichia oblita TaxID=644536 RepID=A0ACB9TM60_HOLOL|nr:hypothetical protein MML48_2g00006309 [Holotrichia oblita]